MYYFKQVGSQQASVGQGTPVKDATCLKKLLTFLSLKTINSENDLRSTSWLANTGSHNSSFIKRPVTFCKNDPAAAPSVSIIGVAKGGTSDMYYHMTQIPSVQSGIRKELGFAHLAARSRKSFREYLVKLQHPCASAVESKLANCLSQENALTVDATPSYL
eukprot:CAMPEP_0177622936 /NCGR_PEP_ID=MMETSP0419_2-20121207/28621_1 /TAXON_ID=582737 /ORGANISM="Tetraselmis sp., Strain GSL018" /LENGTH=160 /DNA_ID=CAMNT_0019123427 /DNA_START=38 /DNA_END=517 /DNA_ORIENTATION=-